MEKNVEISLLLSFYKNMLTERQADTVELYYNEDLSLAEIAAQTGITRQGVRDSIKRSELQLFEFEEKLGLLKKFVELERGLEEISSLSQNINLISTDEKIQLLASQINNIASTLRE